MPIPLLWKTDGSHLIVDDSAVAGMQRRGLLGVQLAPEVVAVAL